MKMGDTYLFNMEIIYIIFGWEILIESKREMSVFVGVFKKRVPRIIRASLLPFIEG